MNPFPTRANKNDLKNIAIHTERLSGRAQCNLFFDQLDEMFHRLAENPSICSRCDYVKNGKRKFPQGSDIIFTFLEQYPYSDSLTPKKRAMPRN